MSIWITVACLLFVVAASAQGTGDPTRSGPVGLISPVPGGPLSAQQVEERTRSLPDGTSNIEILVSQICRDSSGRTRIEFRAQGARGESGGIVYLLDPVAYSVVILLVEQKVADRGAVSRSSPGGFQVGLPAVRQRLPAGKWETKTETLRARMIDGIEVEGVRIFQTSEDQPPLTAVHEKWFSRSLGLTLMEEATGPNGKHTAKIQNVDRREPDPALFVIPPDYTIQGDAAPDTVR